MKSDTGYYGADVALHTILPYRIISSTSVLIIWIALGHGLDWRLHINTSSFSETFFLPLKIHTPVAGPYQLNISVLSSYTRAPFPVNRLLSAPPEVCSWCAEVVGLQTPKNPPLLLHINTTLPLSQNTLPTAEEFIVTSVSQCRPAGW